MFYLCLRIPKKEGKYVLGASGIQVSVSQNVILITLKKCAFPLVNPSKNLKTCNFL